jgi:hypothetical protein
MKTKNIEAHLNGGVEKHLNGTFTIYGYIDNLKSGRMIGRHKCTYDGYTIGEARQRFKSELQDIMELCEENKIFNNDRWIEFDYPHKANFIGGK